MVRIKQIEWSPLKNNWVLIKKTDDKWIFGVVTSFDTVANTLEISALSEYDFHSLTLSVGANISEAWVVKQWSSYTMPAGSASQRPLAYAITSGTSTDSANPADHWLLFKDDIDCWYFGKVESHNPDKNSIKIRTVRNNAFNYEDKLVGPVVEAWAVEKWAKLYPAGGAETEPTP